MARAGASVDFDARRGVAQYPQMVGHRQPPQGEQPALQSVRRGRLGGWRLSALVIGGVAVSLVLVGRFGLPDLAAPAASASPSPTAVAEASPTPTVGWPYGPSPAGPSPTAKPTPTPRLRPVARLMRYRDGIPGYIGERFVARLADLREMPGGGEVLVGGWYADGWLRDGLGTTGDNGRLAVTGADMPTGPVVLRGARGAVDFSFSVSEVVWTGDAQTEAVPIATAPVIGALETSFAPADPYGFGEPVRLELADVALDCPIAWPRHSYTGVSGPVLLLFVFSSPTDRLMAEAAITRSQYPDQSIDGFNPGCPYPVARFTGRTRWLVDGNVMLLIRSGEKNTRLARQALAQARAESDQLEPLWRPVTTWQALRALWTVYPGVDVAPPAEEVWCADGLPPDSWSIRHRWVRGMAVFDSAAEREQFEIATDPTSVRLERGACTGLGGQRPVEAGARWVGAENVLLLVSGPDQIDAPLRDAIPRSRAPFR